MSRQFYLDPLNPVVDVQQKKKYANFTLREVTYGELLEWRAKEEQKEREYKAQLALRDARIAEFKSSIGGTDSPTLKSGLGDWNQKLAYAKERMDGYMKPDKDDLVEHEPWEPTIDPPKPLLKRIWEWVVSFWKSANF